MITRKHFGMVALLTFSFSAQAQELLDAPKLDAAPAAEQDWQFGASATVGANFLENTNVVGQPDGTTSTYSLKLDGEAKRVRDNREWRNTARISETLTRSPIIDKNVKSADKLALESIYLWFFNQPSWLGSYARATAETELFETRDYQPGAVNYAISRRNGTVNNVTDNSLFLSDAFEPLTTKQSLGLVARPINTQPIALEFRVGLGAAQTKADSVLLVKDDAATAGVIEVLELDNVSVVGIETAANAKGDLIEKRVSYDVGVETLTPFTHSPKLTNDKRTNSELTRTEAHAKLALNITEWSALTYGFTSKHDPLLVDKAEVRQEVMATVSYKMAGK